MNRYDEKYLIEEYNEEIKRAIAVCIDYKISFEDFFKDKFILNYVYDILEKKTYNLYVHEYMEQKALNEIYKKYGTINKALRKTMQQTINNIKEYYAYLCYLFDYDKIKLYNIIDKKRVNYEEAKKKDNSAKKAS